jgi:hypothetical protein
MLGRRKRHSANAALRSSLHFGSERDEERWRSASHVALLRSSRSRSRSRASGPKSRPRRSRPSCRASRRRYQRKGSGPTGAPDYAEPIVGWRGWFVVASGERFRLCSPLYRTVWLPRRETVALCQQRGDWWSPAPPPLHAAPQSDCQCGLYASTSVKAAASFVRGRDSLREAIGAVIGRVSLWGTVVECERGWRAARAYPARLYLPLRRHGRLSFLSGPAADAERLAFALRAYGVPVELVACASVRELARVLEREHGEG